MATGSAPWDTLYDTPKATQGPGGSSAALPPWAQEYALDPVNRPPAPVESQAIRMMAQGASLGWSDEAEAAFRSTFGPGKYDSTLKQIQKEIAAYKQDQPGSAFAYEVGGAAALPGPGILRLLAGKSPTLARMLVSSSGTGAIVGGATAAGMQDGTPLERLQAVPGGATIGAALGPVAMGAGMGGQVVLDKIMDFARRRLGGRGASVVEKELQRMATDMDMTPDEIAAKVASGEIMAENATLRDLVRAYTRGGGDAGRVLRESLSRRPGELRQGAMDTLNKYLAPGMTGNVRKVVTATDDELARLENALYENAYGQGAVITEPLLNAMSAAVKRTRGRAAADLEEAYTAQTGNTPFFRINSKGEVSFDRAPTLRDAEVISQGLSDLQNVAYLKGGSGASRGYKDAKEVLRAEVDAASPALAGARAEAAARRTAKDRFSDGKSVFGQNADQVDIDFNALIQSGDVNAVRYFRMGAMDAIRAKMAGGNRTTMLRKLTDPETKEGQILRHIFPGDELDKVVGQLGRANQSAQAAGEILGGSGTAPTKMAEARIGMNLSAGEVAGALSGNLFALPGIAAKMVSKIAPKGLSDAQRKRIADVLVSEDPNVVINALKDESGLAKFQMAVARLTGLLPGAGAGAGGSVGGIVGANIMQTER
jgi:hypothetical protein